jgi:hypothetical protein
MVVGSPSHEHQSLLHPKPNDNTHRRKPNCHVDCSRNPLKPSSLSSFGPYIVHLLCLTSENGLCTLSNLREWAMMQWEKNTILYWKPQTVVRAFIPHHNHWQSAFSKTPRLKHTYTDKHSLLLELKNLARRNLASPNRKLRLILAIHRPSSLHIPSKDSTTLQIDQHQVPPIPLRMQNKAHHLTLSICFGTFCQSKSQQPFIH